MMKRTIVLASIIAILVVGLAGCSTASSTAPAAASQPATSTASPVTTAPPASTAPVAVVAPTTAQPASSAGGAATSDADLLAQLAKASGGPAKDGAPAVQSDFNNSSVALAAGDTLKLVNGQVSLDVSGLGAQAHFYNVALADGKTVYFFVVKDKAGVYRAAANACQVCFSTKRGFHQEGDWMVCNTCGNRYPLSKIATEKGGCNPVPINPNLKVNGGKATLQLADLEQIANYF
jgi:hypothetical protein